MALPSLATIGDVEIIGAGGVSDPAQTEALLRLASARVRAYTGCTWVDESGSLDGVPDGVAEVVASMVVRALQNPRGVTQETAGPFNVSYGTDAASRVYLTATDRALLDAVRCKSRLWVLSVTRGDLETPDVDECAEFVSPSAWPED